MRADEVAGQARADRLARLVEEARRVGPLREVDLALPESGRVYRLLQPADMDALLDAVEYDPEQNLPYWAEIWPSGIALGDLLEREPGLVGGARALEVGCGLGVTAIAALRAGADLLAADYAPEALVLCRANALANAGREPDTLQFNWRRPGPDLLDLAGAGFPVVLAADVLYESRDVDPLLALLGRLLAPGGALLLAEPGRPVAARFLDAARSGAWRVETLARHAGPWPDPKDQGVVVGVHRLAPPPRPR